MSEISTFDIDVDWDADGSFTDPNSDITADVLYLPVEIVRGRDFSRPLSPPQAGEARFSVANDDNKYHPENSGSVLTGNLVPGRDLRIRTVYSTVTYDLFRGNLDELNIDPNPGQRRANFVALDGLAAEKELSTAVTQNAATGTLIGLILDEIGWSATRRNLDTGILTVPLWWEEGTSAFDALVKLVQSEGPGAALFVDGSGDVVFHDRHHRLLTAVSNTSQATFRDTGTEPVYSIPQTYQPPWAGIVNDITISVTRRSQGALQTVWTYSGGTIGLGASESRILRVKADNPCTSLTDPVGGTDYTLLSGSVTSATLDRSSGQTATLTITAGAGGASLNGLIVRGRPWSADDAVEVSSSDATSQTAYGVRSPASFDTTWVDDENEAQSLADAIIAAYKDPVARVSITVSNANSTRYTQVLSREVNDRITIVDADSGMNKEFYIDRIIHAISDAGTVHKAIFDCTEAVEPLVSSSQVFILNSATQGKLNTNKLGW